MENEQKERTRKQLGQIPKLDEEKGNTLKTCLMLMASGVTLGRPSQTDTCEVNT